MVVMGVSVSGSVSVSWRVAVTAALVLLLALVVHVAYVSMRDRERERHVRGRFTVSWEPPQQRVALALDLDETLVHSDGWGTLVRPGADAFLRAVSGMFDELALFTAGTEPYARPIVDRLEASSGVRIAHRLYRDSCTPVVNSAGDLVGYAKDLTKVSNMTGCATVLLLDNTPMAYSLQPESGVPISSFYDDMSDTALAAVLPELQRRLEGLRRAPGAPQGGS